MVLVPNVRLGDTLLLIGNYHPRYQPSPSDLASHCPACGFLTHKIDDVDGSRYTQIGNASPFSDNAHLISSE